MSDLDASQTDAAGIAATPGAGASPGVLSVDGDPSTLSQIGGGAGKGLQAFGAGIKKQAAPPLPQQHIDDFHALFGGSSTAPHTSLPPMLAAPPVAAAPPPMAPPPMVAVSDARAKTSVRSGAQQVRAFLDALARSSPR